MKRGRSMFRREQAIVHHATCMDTRRTAPNVPLILLISLALLLSSLPLVPWENITGIDSAGTTRSQNSLDGEYKADEICMTRFIGESSQNAFGMLGSYIGHADVNGDGIEDLYMSAPRLNMGESVTESGRCYIWYGGNESLKDQPELDLDDNSPDIIIEGTSPFSQAVGILRSGDIDGDGFTDMVIGNPLQPESGKVYILWGSGDPWPSVIQLYPAKGSEPNGFPVGFLRTSEYTVISGLVTTSVLGTHLGEDIEIGDLDRDGLDDVVISFYGWNAVLICWGNSDRMDIGSDLTYIKNNSEVSNFGKNVELGDIDGNGTLDLVISAPMIDDERRGVYQAGGIFVYYDPYRFKGSFGKGSGNYLRPLIMGKDPYDRIGLGLLVRDINGDGKDDILIGAPGDDGPMNSRSQCGAIMVFNGRNISGFSDSFVGMDHADTIIYGINARQGGEQGDNLGGMFAVGDVDLDNEPELLFSTSTRDLGAGDNVGSILLFETKDTFRFPGGVADLRGSEPRMKIWGIDPSDSFGSSIALFDFNGDEAMDIFSASPSADGDGNSRPNCGEVYQFPGSSIRIEGLTISGTGTSEGDIFSGSGTVFLSVNIVKNPDASAIDKVNVTLDPGGRSIVLSYADDVFTILNDPFSTIHMDLDESTFSTTLNRARVTFAFDTTLFFDLPKRPLVLVNVSTEGGEELQRIFEDPFESHNDIQLTGELEVGIVDGRVQTGNDWFKPNDSIVVKGLYLTYRDDENVRYDGAVCSLKVGGEGIPDQTIPYMDGWSVNIILPDLDGSNISVEIDLDPDAVPYGFPVSDLPDLGMKRIKHVNLDRNPPLAPSGISLISEDDEISQYDDDTERWVKWTENAGMTLDRGGSGVKCFEVSVNGSQWKPAMKSGGLLATFFKDRNFHEVAEITDGNSGEIMGYREMVDTSMVHTRDEWGAFPPYLELDPANYSVRWHGWFRAFDSRDHRFSLSGSGEVKMILGDECLIDWSQLSETPVSPPVYMESGETRSITILLRNYVGPSNEVWETYMSLKMEDKKGFMNPMDPAQLLFPSNITKIITPSEESFPVRVRSVDWAGLVSETVSITGYTDLAPPVFDLSLIERWYPSTSPAIKVRIRDPAINGIDGSGVDPGNVSYRIREGVGGAFSNWTSMTFTIGKGGSEEAPVEVEATVIPHLDEKWKGSIQFTAFDRAGNRAISSVVDIGVDLEGPDFELLRPNLLLVQREGNIEWMLKAFDRPGSGVNASNLEMRYREMNGDWSIWYRMNGSGISEEVFATISLFLPEGEFEVQFRGFDAVGNLAMSQPMSVKVEKEPEDLPPVARISSPVEGQRFKEGTPILLDGSNSEDDGNGRFERLRFSWFSNRSGLLGVGSILTVYLDDVGVHRITLYVDDGSIGHNISTFVNITVEELDIGYTSGETNGTGESSNLMVLLIGSLVTVIVLVLLLVFILIRYKKRREEEIMLEYRERTVDDELYESRIREEEKNLGIHEEEVTRTQEEIEREREILYGSLGEELE